MPKYLKHVLVAVGVFALALPVALISGGPPAGVSALALFATSTRSPVLTNTPIMATTRTLAPETTNTPIYIATNTPSSGIVSTPTQRVASTPTSTDTPGPGAVNTPTNTSTNKTPTHKVTHTPTYKATSKSTVTLTQTETPIPKPTSIDTPASKVPPGVIELGTDTPTPTSMPTDPPTITPAWMSTPLPMADALSITSPQIAYFAGVTLNGANQTTTAALASFMVSDYGASAVGWHVMVHATQFTDPNGHHLALGSLKMSAPIATTSGPGASPTISDGPYTLDSSQPLQIASAPAGTGLGAYNFSATTLSLTIPSDSYAGTYNSTITISVVAGP